MNCIMELLNYVGEQVGTHSKGYDNPRRLGQSSSRAGASSPGSERQDGGWANGNRVARGEGGCRAGCCSLGGDTSGTLGERRAWGWGTDARGHRQRALRSGLPGFGATGESSLGLAAGDQGGKSRRDDFSKERKKKLSSSKFQKERKKKKQSCSRSSSSSSSSDGSRKFVRW